MKSSNQGLISAIWQIEDFAFWHTWLAEIKENRPQRTLSLPRDNFDQYIINVVLQKLRVWKQILVNIDHKNGYNHKRQSFLQTGSIYCSCIYGINSVLCYLQLSMDAIYFGSILKFTLDTSIEYFQIYITISTFIFIHPCAYVSPSHFIVFFFKFIVPGAS